MERFDSDNIFCPDCKGRGKIEGLFFSRKCRRCKGEGIIRRPTLSQRPPEEKDEDSGVASLIAGTVIGGLVGMDISEPIKESEPEIVPGGGEFGGAGATGSWDEGKPSIEAESSPIESEPESPSESESESSGDSSSDSGSDSGGDSGGGGGDD